jgi:hypothetical protein
LIWFGVGNVGVGYVLALVGLGVCIGFDGLLGFLLLIVSYYLFLFLLFVLVWCFCVVVFAAFAIPPLCLI